MRRGRLRLFDYGPCSIGFRCRDAHGGGSSSVDELGDPEHDDHLFERADLELANVHSAFPSYISHAARSPLLQNR